jgi:predicted nucleic acid-binding protein
LKTRILDSWAVIEWLSGRQPASGAVANLLAESKLGTARLFMSAIRNAALLKGRYPIAYADAFAAALAQKYRCPLVTGDPELRSIADLELDWIGRSPA